MQGLLSRVNIICYCHSCLHLSSNDILLLACRGNCISDHKLFRVVLKLKMICKIWYANPYQRLFFFFLWGWGGFLCMIIHWVFHSCSRTSPLWDAPRCKAWHQSICSLNISLVSSSTLR